MNFKKRIISWLCAVGILFSFGGQALEIQHNSYGSRVSDKLELNGERIFLGESPVKFLETSEDKLVYTFKENNKEFKYIEYISQDRDEIYSEKYEKIGDKFILFDELYTKIKLNSIHIKSQMTDYKETINIDVNHLEQEEKSVGMLRSNKEPDWVFHSGPNYYTRYMSGNLTIAIIAGMISAVVPYVTVKLVTAAAAVYFAARSDTFYVELYTYKDANRPKLMPSFKSIAKFYYDRNHNDYLGSRYDAVTYYSR